MTHFTDHVDKLDTLVQHLEECGLSRDVALAAALHRFPPLPSEVTSISAEVAALAVLGKPALGLVDRQHGRASAFDSIPKLANCEPLDVVLSTTSDGVARGALRLRACQRAGSPYRLMFKGLAQVGQAEIGLRLLAEQKPLALTFEGATRFGLLWAFKLDQEREGTWFTMEFHVAKDTAIQPVPGANPVSAEAKHLPPRNTALFIEREVGGKPSSMLAANVGKWSRGASVRQGDRLSSIWRTTISGRIKGDSDLGLLRATENVRFLDSGDHLVLAGQIACISLIPMSPDTLEWVIEVDSEVATVAGQPLPPQPRLVSLKRAAALWELLRDIERLDPAEYVDQHDYAHKVRHIAKRRDQYLSGGHLITVSDQTREMTAEESADGAATATAVRDACMDAAARASERDAAIDQRDTLIDREAQMRGAVLAAIGPVSTGSTLDLVRALVDLYKASKASYERAHEAHISAVGVLESAAGMAKGSSHRSIVELAQKVQGLLNEARGGRSGAEMLLAQTNEKLKHMVIERESMTAELETAKRENADLANLREHNLQLQATLSKVRAAMS